MRRQFSSIPVFKYFANQFQSQLIQIGKRENRKARFYDSTVKAREEIRTIDIAELYSP